MTSFESPFVGDGRKSLVKGLVAALDSVNTTGSPLWISLEAPAGWGKSRIVSEFYRTLSSYQPDPHYWPASLVSDAPDGPLGVTEIRKRVFPTFNHVPHSLPSFMWFGIACDRRNGALTVSLAEDAAQLTAHEPFLNDAWRIKRLSSILKTGFEGVGEAVRDEVVSQGVGLVVEEVIGAAVPGLGLLQWSAGRAAEGFIGARERRKRVATSTSIESSFEDLVNETSQKVVRLARPGLPIVIFAEDIHMADTVLIDFLTLLMQSSAAVLIVSTGYSGDIDKNVVLARAMSSFRDSTTRISETSEIASELFTHSSSLSALDHSDLVAIVEFHYPRADRRTSSAIASRYTNPLALQLWCELPLNQARFQSGNLLLTQTEIEAAPRTIEDLYRALWSGLSPDTQRALTLASWAIPSVLEPDTGRGAAWNREIVLEALSQIRLQSADSAADVLRDSVSIKSWVRNVDADLLSFHELDQQNVAAQSDSHYSQADRDLFIEKLRGAVNTRLASTGQDESPQARQAARTFLALHAKQSNKTDSLLGLATVIAFEELEDSPMEVKEHLRLCAYAIENMTQSDPYRWAVRSRHAMTLLAAEQPTKGTAELENVVVEMNHSLPQDDGNLLTARTLLARAYQQNQRPNDALAIYQEVLAIRREKDGDSGINTLAIRGDIIAVDMHRGRYMDAIAAYKTLIEDEEKALDQDRLQVLHNRANLATAYFRVGKFNDAVLLATAVLDDLVTLFGSEYPDSMQARTFLADVYVAMERGDEALQLYTQLSKDLDNAYGPDYPGLFEIAGKIADLNFEIGQLEYAYELREEMLAQAREKWGANSVQCFIQRFHLAVLIAAAGKKGKGLEQQNELLAEMISAGVIDGPLREAVRRHIAIGFEETGRPEDALPIFTALRDEKAAQNGMRHESVLSLQNDMGIAHQALENHYEALQIFTDLIRIQTEDGKESHTSTAGYMHNLARTYREMGLHDEALETLEQSLAITIGAVGDDHPMSLGTRSEIAKCYWYKGERTKAVEQTINVRQDSHQALGPDHPITLGMRYSLAFFALEMGQVERAVSVYRDLRPDQRRVLGDDHHQTKMTLKALEANGGWWPPV